MNRLRLLVALGLSGLSCAPVPSPPSAPAACAAQDARDEGLDCTGIVGYVFDGTRCFGITCSCTGADCGDLAATQAACEARFATCL